MVEGSGMTKKLFLSPKKTPQNLLILNYDNFVREEMTLSTEGFMSQRHLKLLYSLS